jgi:hypothetical protein
MKLYSTIIFLCMIASITIGAELDTVSYQSVPQLVASGGIEKVEIYDSGMNDIDAVFIKADGTTIAVEKPHGLDKDSVFHQYLKDNNVQYIVYDYKYGEEGISSRGPFGKSKMWFMLLPMLLVFGVPVLLILVIMRQAKTISKQADTIEALANKKNSQPIK